MAALVALALLAVAVIAVVEILAAWLGRDPWLIPRRTWLNDLRTRSWDDPAVRVFFAIAAALGLALFIGQLWPRRPVALAVTAQQEPLEPPVRVRAEIERRALESRVERVAGGVDGVRKAHARVRRRDLLVEVATRRKYSTLEGAVRERVEEDLIRVRLQRPRHVRIRVRRV